MQIDPPPTAARRGRVRGLALGAGLAAALAVLLVRSTGLLRGDLAVVVTLLLALGVPTSRHLSRRILLLAGFATALVPALWWWRLPVGTVGRASVLLAVLAGSLVTALLWEGPRGCAARARTVLPERHRVDLVVAVAAAASAWVAAGWLRLSSGAAALAALLPAWDNSAHLNMVLMLRRHGASIGSLGAAAGDGTWKFGNYPQGYHALVAAVMELERGTSFGPVDAEVLAYAHVQGLVVVGTATLLAAAVCALPAARRWPSRALVLAAFVVASFVVGPGAAAVRDGFANFTTACALAVCAVVLASILPRRITPHSVPYVLALAGLVVGVAQTWALMLCVALPAATLIALPLRRRARRADRRAVAVVLAAVAIVLVGLAQTARTLAGLDPGEVLVIPGAITTVDPGILAAVIAAAIGLTVWPRGSQRRRTTWLALVPLCGAATVLAVGAVQLVSGGGLSYYFWKLLTGVALVCTGVIAVALARWPAEPAPRPAAARLRLAGAVAVACITATQVFGFTGRGRAALPVSTDHLAVAQDLLEAAAATQRTSAPRTTFLAVEGIHPINSQQWLLALTGRWTVAANDDAGALVGADGRPRTAAADVPLVLARPGTVVIASPRDAAALRAEPTLAPYADRILSW